MQNFTKISTTSRWIAISLVFFIVPFAALALTQPPPLDFQVASTDNKTLRGSWQELTSNGGVRLANEKVTIAADKWLTLRRSSVPLPPHPRGPQIVYANGDRLTLPAKSAVKLIGKNLHFEPDATSLSKPAWMEPPLATVSLLWLAAPDAAEDPSLLLRQLTADNHAKDLVLLRNGDRVEGTVKALDSAKGCQIATGTREVPVAWASIAAVALNSAGRVWHLPDKRYYHLVLENGCRLALATAELAQGAKVLTGKTLFGNDVQIPLAKIIALDVRGGPATYLSDLQPSKYEHTAFAGPAWPLVHDGSVSGHELRLAGSTFDKGLGTHSQCRISYDLAGNYRWFEALVGLDPEHGQRGRVMLRVLVDGKSRELGWNKELTAGDDPLALRIDVVNAKQLTLEVLWSNFGDVQGHVNWADARVIR